MKKFIIKTFPFLVTVPFLYLLFYISIDFYLNDKNNKNAIYIWGDSQTYQGIDIQVLRDSTKINTYSYARHGAGVYDFLVFAERVPNQSTIVLGVSKPVQLRPKKSDRNISGVSFTALVALYENGYSINELKNIIKKNKVPIKTLQVVTNMYKYNDTIIFRESIEAFEKVYKKIPSYLYEKQNLYKIGIEKLRKKQCNIFFVDFPSHSLLKTIENKSLINKKMKSFSKWIINSSKKIEIDSLVLNTDKQVMHDLTHLNEFGAEQVSLYISKKMRKYEHIAMHIKNDQNSSNIEVSTPFELYCKVNN